MKHLRLVAMLVFSMIFFNLYAQQVVYSKQGNAFPLVDNEKAAAIYYDTADAKVISIGAHLFANDVYLVSGKTSMNQTGEIIFSGGGKQFVVQVSAAIPARADLNGYNGLIEDYGIVSIYAHRYSKNSGGWQVIDGLGYKGKSLEAVEPLTVVKDPVKKSASFVSYDFFTFHTSTPVVNIYTLPTHPLNKNYSMRYGVSIDDGPMQVVDFRTYGRSEEWKQNVLRNNAIRKVTMAAINKGRHTFTIYAIDPGVILDRIVIDLGGLKSAYGPLPQSKFWGVDRLGGD